MRSFILLGLAAALGAAGAGVPAAAQYSTLGGGPAVGNSPSTGAGVVSRGPGARPGHHRGWRDGRRGRGERHGRYRHRIPYSAGYGLAVAYEPASDPRGDGFFAGFPGEVRVESGRAVYDYDRSYPYDWRPGTAAHPSGHRSGQDHGPTAIHCSFEQVPAGRAAVVRVCRGGR